MPSAARKQSGRLSQRLRARRSLDSVWDCQSRQPVTVAPGDRRRLAARSVVVQQLQRRGSWRADRLKSCGQESSLPLWGVGYSHSFPGRLTRLGARQRGGVAAWLRPQWRFAGPAWDGGWWPDCPVLCSPALGFAQGACGCDSEGVHGLLGEGCWAVYPPPFQAILIVGLWLARSV